MKKSDVKIGESYIAKVSNNLVQVRIDSAHSRQGWNATNVATGRRVHLKTAQRLRARAGKGSAKSTAAAQADHENARLGKERAKSPDGMTTSERAMATSAKKTPITKADAKDAVAAVVANDAKTVQAAKATTTKEAAPAKAAKAAKDAKPAKAAKPATTKDAKPKRTSALDAAAAVLHMANKPMRAQELIAAMADEGLWKSPAGKTPHATLYAAILREIRAKGDDARFRKVDRGQFTHAG